MTTTPVLWARRERNLLKAWCPYCRREHTHGNSPGHLVAHCPIGTGFEAKRDYILEVHDLSAAEIRAHNEKVRA